MALRDLRNGVAGELNYPTTFALQVAAYGMTTDEMVKMNEDFMNDLRPLYLQLHTWAKYKLAEKYHQPVPDKIPAHWLNNRWAQNWTGLVRGGQSRSLFQRQDPRMDREDGGRFLCRARFEPLPGKFLDEIGSVSGAGGRSAQEKHPRFLLAHRPRQRHPLACKASSPTRNGFSPRTTSSGTAITFSPTRGRKCRRSCARAQTPGFHEGIGELISLASSQVPYLQAKGILPADFKADKTAFLLDDALARSIPFIFFASGTMTHWEADIYAHHSTADRLERSLVEIRERDSKASSRRANAAKNGPITRPRRTSTTRPPTITITLSRPC